MRTLSIVEHSSPTSHVRIRSIASQPFEFYMFKYSYDSLVYFGEPVDRSIARLARFGYDAIELVGESDKYDTKEVTRLVGDHVIKVSSIAFELLPASGDPFGALEKGEGKEFFDQYTEQASRTIKKLEQQLS